MASNPAQLTDIVCDSTTQEWFFGSLAAVDNIPMDALKAEICMPGFEQTMLGDIMGMYDVQGYIVDVSISGIMSQYWCQFKQLSQNATFT